MKQRREEMGAALRRLVTYWDRIDAPLVSVLPIEYGAEWDELVREGIASRTPVPDHFLRGVIFGDTILQSEGVVYQQRRQLEPGAWAVAKTSGGSGVWPEPFPDTEALAFDLTECLPVPSVQVPIAAILDFKRRRQDELHAFRVHMDGLREAVLKAGDQATQMRSVMDHIDKAIADLCKSMSESFTVSIIRSVRSLVAIGSGAALGAIALPTHKVVGAGLGAGATLGISHQKTKKPAGAPDGEPFAYVQSVVGLDVTYR
ncbi:MAG TPA: DUF6236 family protein [Polyangia bacterium]|nr:DUF6236 family protein [Polyangia bacterium]